MKNIKVINLKKSYHNNIIINNFNYVFDSEHIYFLCSENGTGKTTLFKCLLRETNFTGQIKDNDLIYAYLPEQVIFPYFANVAEFLEIFYEVDYYKANKELIDDKLKEFAIDKYREYDLHKISKGTRQKVLIIKTLLSKADVFLFDEPLNGLDRTSRLVFMKEVETLQKKGKIVIIATHYFDEYKYDNKEIIDLRWHI